MFVIWLIVSIAAILIDIFTSAFLFVWFAAGGIAAFIASLLGYDFLVQLALFVVISLISIAVGYPWAKRKFKNSIKRTPLMEETYIGKEFIAQEDIEKQTRIKVEGIYWTGYNKGKLIKKGDKFKITGIDGNKLIIKSLEEE